MPSWLKNFYSKPRGKEFLTAGNSNFQPLQLQTSYLHNDNLDKSIHSTLFITLHYAVSFCWSKACLFQLWRNLKK